MRWFYQSRHFSSVDWMSAHPVRRDKAALSGRTDN
jgi:hypothetical protein